MRLEIRPLGLKIDLSLSFYLSHRRIWPWWLKKPVGVLQKFVSDLYSRLMGQRAGFVAFLCNDTTDYLLTLSCFPIHFKSQVIMNSHIPSTYTVNFQGEGTSLKPLCAEDQTFVSLSEAFTVKQNRSTEDLYLT